MKKSRSIALDYALLSGCVSLMIATVCWLFNKPLTVDEYNIPFDFRKGEYIFFTIPPLSIWFLPIVVTLVTFQWVYLRQLFIEGQEVAVSGVASGTIFGIILGTIFGIILGAIPGIILGTTSRVILGIIFGITFGTMMGTIFGIILGMISKITLGITLGIIFGTILGIITGTILGTTNILVFMLCSTDYGFGEVIGYSLVAFCILVVINMIVNNVLYFFLAIIERLVLIVKSSQITGLAFQKAGESFSDK